MVDHGDGSMSLKMTHKKAGYDKYRSIRSTGENFFSDRRSKSTFDTVSEMLFGKVSSSHRRQGHKLG